MTVKNSFPYLDVTFIRAFCTLDDFDSMDDDTENRVPPEWKENTVECVNTPIQETDDNTARG